MRDAVQLDAFVADVIIARLSRSDAAALLVEDEAPDAADLQSRAIVLRRRLEEIAESFGEGEMTRAQFKTANQRARTELESVEARMSRVGGGRGQVLGDLVEAEDVRAAWEGLDISRRQAVMDVLMDVVVLPAPRGRLPGWRPGEPYFDTNSIEILWKVPS